MFGMPFGAVLLGYASDRFGRRKGLVMSLLVLAFGELGSSFAVNFYMFLVLRFISGAGSIASFQNSIIPGKSTRTWVYFTFTNLPSNLGLISCNSGTLGSCSLANSVVKTLIIRVSLSWKYCYFLELGYS